MEWDANGLALSIACLLWGDISKGEKILSIAAEGHLVGEKKIFETSIFKKKWNDKYITCTYIFVYQISQDSQQLEVNIYTKSSHQKLDRNI